MEIFLIFILGLEFGSFANVCIYRWPRNQSIMNPLRSYCPWCRTRIAWRDNIPLLSFLLLSGKCRNCRSPISWRYPLIEILLPLLWVGAFLFFNLNALEKNWAFLIAIFSLLFVILVTTATDVDWKIIPDNATFTLISMGLLISPWNPFLEQKHLLGALIESTHGALVGAGTLYLVAVVGRFLFEKEAMGGGDIKLLAGIGTLLGWQGALLTIFLGSLLGGCAAMLGISMGILKRREYIPFGPFLNMGALLTLFFLLRCVSHASDPCVFSFFRL